MATPARSNPVLGAGLAFSLLAHAVAGLALATAWQWDGGGDPLLLEAPSEDSERREHERPPVRLGIERSRAVTMTWLGFEVPTEHAARQSEVEQSAMSPSPAPARDPAPAPEVAEASDPSAESAARPARVVIAVRSLAQSIGERAAEVAQIAESAIAVGLEEAAALALDAATQESETAASATPAEPESVAGGAPGEEEPKESPATSLDQAIRVVPGKVAAGQGLEIFTQRPRWPLTTLALRAPRNPVLRITFGPGGRVVDARFAKEGSRELSTGFSDVDEPLLTAVYRWTARGKALDELPAEDPEAGVTVNLRIILQGG